MMKLTMWCGVATAAAILLGLLMMPVTASAGTEDKGLDRMALFIQYPKAATSDADGDSGSFSISGAGVLCPDYLHSGIHWADPTDIEYWINTAGSGVSAATTISSVRAAFDTWDNACGPLSFSYGGPTSLEAGDMDSKNVVSWGDLSSYPGAVAITFYRYDYSNHITEVDTLMNDSLDWSYSAPNVNHDLSGVATLDAGRYGDPTNEGTAGTYDIRNTMTHEAGHWLILDDLYGDSQSELTMYGYTETGDLKGDTLAYGDELGIESIYQTQVTVNTSGLASSHPVSIRYRQGGIAKTVMTSGTWSSPVDDGSAVSIDSEVAISSTERYRTESETSWNTTESAAYAVPYYHQYRCDISAVTAGSNHTDLDASNHATLTYQQYGSTLTFSVFDSQSFNDWMDAGSTASLSSLSSTSTSTHRWHNSGADSWTVSDADPQSASYLEEYRVAIATAGLDASSPAGVSYVQDGVAKNASVSDAWSDWADVGSTIAIDDTVAVSPTERYRTTLTNSWTADSAVTARLSYKHQFLATISVAGLGQFHPTTITFVQGDATGSAAVYETWSDWVDANSALRVGESVEGGWVGDWTTNDITDWTIHSPVSTSLGYHRSHVGLYLLAVGPLVVTTVVGAGMLLFLLLLIRRNRHALRGSPNYLSGPS